jgi:hypothetical protein
VRGGPVGWGGVEVERGGDIATRDSVFCEGHAWKGLGGGLCSCLRHDGWCTGRL